jgi:glutathione S-transferase
MIKIYGVPVSVHTRKVIIAAILKEIPHEVVPVVPVIPDNPPPNWRQLSATGKIPALTDGDFTLADSAAICAYLEELRPTPSLYPQDARGYATALSLEQYGGTLFNQVVHPLFHEVFVRPKVQGVPTDECKIQAVQDHVIPEVFGYLDRLATGDYLVGSSLTVADLAVTSNLITYQYIGFDLYRERFPRLARWFDRMLKQPAVAEALRRERPVVESMGLRKEFLSAA